MRRTSQIGILGMLCIVLSMSLRAGVFGPAARPGDPHQARLKALMKMADSLFNFREDSLATIPMDRMKVILAGRTASWQQALAQSGLTGEDQQVAITAGKAHGLVTRSTYVRANPWANFHADALSGWVLGDGTLHEPGLDKLDFNLMYNYLRYYLNAKVGSRALGPQENQPYSPLSGQLNQYIYLLESDCPEPLKHLYLNFMLPSDLKRNRISPEISVLEPYIRKAFRDPATNHYYDSLLNSYHRLDRGNPAPDFTLKNYDGKTIRLSDLRGKKVVLDVWATWCHVCVENLPRFDSVVAANKDPNTLFFTLSIDEVDSASESIAYRRYVEDHHMDHATSLTATKENLAAFRAAYGITEVPHYFIFDKEGRILTLHSISVLDPEWQWFLKE